MKIWLGPRLVCVASPSLPELASNFIETRENGREEKSLYVERDVRDRRLDRDVGEFGFLGCFCFCFVRYTTGPNKSQIMEKNIGLVTLNVKGLGSVTERKRIESLLKKNKVDIIYLEETPQSKDGVNELKLQNIHIYEKGFGTSKSKGVATLISKKWEFAIKDVVKDRNRDVVALWAKPQKPVLQGQKIRQS